MYTHADRAKQKADLGEEINAQGVAMEASQGDELPAEAQLGLGPTQRKTRRILNPARSVLFPTYCRSSLAKDLRYIHLFK